MKDVPSPMPLLLRRLAFLSAAPSLRNDLEYRDDDISRGWSRPSSARSHRSA